MAMQANSLLKIISIIVGFIVLVIILKGIISPSQTAKTRPSTKTLLQTATDTASPDTTNESLKALSAQIQQVSDQNKEIVARDKKIQEENKQNVAYLQQQIQSRLSKIDQRNQQIQQTQEVALQQKVRDLKNNPLSSQYPIGENNGITSNLTTTADDIPLTWVDDMQTSLSPTTTMPKNAHVLFNSKYEPSDANNNSLLPFTSKQNQHKAADKPIPRYTIPANSVLANTTTMTGLIGRIPINGIVRDPYSFLLIVGPENLAANSAYMPDVAKVMVSGTATGDMALSCVRGSITSLTFVFQDGTISTVNANTKGNQGNSLGYLTTSNGNPCITGHFYTNAPAFLTGNILLGAAQGAAGAYSAEQTTSTTNMFGGATSNVTGSPTKYVLGQAGMNAANQAQQWWNAREQNSFDAVYVAPNTEVAVVVNQEIPIDYNPEGRKVAYGITASNIVNPDLD